MIQANIEDKIMNLTDFDTSKFKLGTLCKRGHDYKGTGMSLRVKNGACLECERDRSKKRYEKNKDYHREYCKNNSDRRREYYEKNREHYVQYHKKYRADNKDRLAKCKKEYYEKNREHYVQYHKKYRADNKDRLAKCKKEYYEENKERIGKYKKSWRIANPDKVRHRSEIRRVKIKRQSDGSITTGRVKKLIASAAKCPYCLKKMAHEEKVADHIIPVSRGGLNSIYNLVICCNDCNVRKSARSYPEWLDCLEPEQRKSAERLYYKRYGVSPLQGHLPLVFDQEDKSD